MRRLYTATLTHTSSNKPITTACIITPHDITEAELVTRIKIAVGTHIIVSHYPHTATHTDKGIRLDLTGCRYHIEALRIH